MRGREDAQITRPLEPLHQLIGRRSTLINLGNNDEQSRKRAHIKLC